MCGISGFLYFDGAPVEERVIRDMTGVLKHRGPDEDGIYTGRGAALGHRRLSIIDLSTGQQPLCNEDRKVWISFNGEIYNHLSLRKMLEERGHTYLTASDTETIIHLYEEFGAGLVDHLRGMFGCLLSLLYLSAANQVEIGSFLARARRISPVNSSKSDANSTVCHALIAPR